MCLRAPLAAAHRFPMRLIVRRLMALACCVGPEVAAASDDAAAILAAAGRDQGRCVVLGCGSRTKPALLARIAVASRMLVHGIAPDTEALLRARAEIDRTDVRGRCMVERIPLSPLPYVPDSANLVVIEDPSALQSQAIAGADVLKIIAPGGVVCRFAGGQWRTEVKPRPAGMADWTHTAGTAGGNRVSRDSLATFPAGVRWMDGVPMLFPVGVWWGARGMVR